MLGISDKTSNRKNARFHTRNIMFIKNLVWLLKKWQNVSVQTVRTTQTYIIDPYFILNKMKRVVKTMHCNENPIYVFLFWELRGLNPNFHIHVSVSAYIFPGSATYFLQQNRQIDRGKI
jgi:hypothetical protein